MLPDFIAAVFKHPNTLQDVLALQHTATHCNMLQHTHYQMASSPCASTPTRLKMCWHCNTLQHTATHCNTLQHTATNMLPDGIIAAFEHPNTPQDVLATYAWRCGGAASADSQRASTRDEYLEDYPLLYGIHVCICLHVYKYIHMCLALWRRRLCGGAARQHSQRTSQRGGPLLYCTHVHVC